MIDSHCHLNLPPLNVDLDEVISSAKQNGITRILLPGITVSSWAVQKDISQRYCDQLPIDLALGLHPYFLAKTRLSQLNSSNDEIHQLEQAIDDPTYAVKAVGETGLDAVIDVPLEIQKDVLDKHLAIASNAKLPVILHHRKSHHLLFEALKKRRFKYGGVVHGFSGSIDVAKRYINMGFSLGIGGTITYQRARKTRDTVAHLLKHQLDSVLLETDAPDMPMWGRQGQCNKPEYLVDVVNVLCRLGDCSAQHIISATTNNYTRLFLG